MNIDELKNEVIIYLRLLGVPEWEHLVIGGDVAHWFVVDMFSTLICIVEESNINFVATRILDLYKEHRVVYVTKESSLNVSKEKILWEFMRSGYMRWLRYTYPTKFRYAITEQGFGTKILKKRISLYSDNFKYKFWREDDEAALTLSSSYLLSAEPGFYDYMPEEELM
jgi:hypothetical protein